jgi:hypothetical protein
MRPLALLLLAGAAALQPTQTLRRIQVSRRQLPSSGVRASQPRAEFDATADEDRKSCSRRSSGIDEPLVNMGGKPLAAIDARMINGKPLAAIVNGAAIGAMILAGAFLILRHDVEAIAALYLQPLPEVGSRLEIALAVLQRLPSDWLGWYDSEALAHPVLTKAATSGVCYLAGDLIAQLIGGNDLETIDLSRSSRSAAAGFIGHGPVAHYWLNFVEQYFSFGGAWVWAHNSNSALLHTRGGT